MRMVSPSDGPNSSTLPLNVLKRRSAMMGSLQVTELSILSGEPVATAFRAKAGRDPHS
jgi:hypothetical protein